MGDWKAFSTTKVLLALLLVLSAVALYANLNLYKFQISCTQNENHRSITDQIRSNVTGNDNRGQLNRIEVLLGLGEEAQRFLDVHQQTRKADVRVCNKSLVEGFSCTINTLSFCFLQALSNNQSFGIGFRAPEDPQKRKFFLSREAFESAFLPFSIYSDPPGERLKENTTALSRQKREKYANRRADFNLWGKKRMRLAAVPERIREAVNSLHPNPLAWWMGQVASYIMRLRPALEGQLAAFQMMRNASPVVGIHVRRSDKLANESDLFQLEEYLVLVESWFKRYEFIERFQVGKGNFTAPRRVFLATEDAGVIEEAKKKYPQIDFLYSEESVRVAADPASRFSSKATVSVVLDIHRLVACDFVVCTFSSNVCRLVYELMQARYGDATERLRSIDIAYNYQWYPQPLFHQAVLAHSANATGALELKVGDRILAKRKDPHSNKWLGVNQRTKKEGLYPDHKVEPEFLVY